MPSSNRGLKELNNDYFEKRIPVQTAVLRSVLSSLIWFAWFDWGIWF